MVRIYEPITQYVYDYCNRCFYKKSKMEEYENCELVDFDISNTDLQCDSCGVLLNRINNNRR